MKKSILIVDDDALNREILAELLSDDYDVATAEDGEEGLQKMKDVGADLVLLDIMMPGIDGYEVCRQIKSGPTGNLTLVALVSGRASVKERVAGYNAGADDYIVKPFEHDEITAKIAVLFRLRGTLLELALAKSEIEVNNAKLEQLVQERAAEVIETRDVTVFALAKLAESRDTETGEHLERMRRYTQILAEKLGEEGPYTNEIDAEFLRHLHLSSPLHDIGKVGIPDAVLLKPGRLSQTEFDIMKGHTVIGAEALEGAAKHTKSGGFLGMAAQIARSHHERFNGSGYPDGLVGLDIPLSGRIVAIADVYDALTSVRVYKAAFTPELAKTMIEDEEGEHFDPAIVDGFRACYDRFLAVHEEYNSVEEQLLPA